MASLEEKSPNEEGACAAPPEELELELDNGGDCDLDGCIEDSMDSELTCKICQDTMQNAKMLSCFHTFCQTCLENVVKKEISKIDGEPIKTPDTVTCPDCMQMTSLPSGKVENLMTNLLLEDRLNPSQDNPTIICTSCKAKEKAVAHCVKCPNFLCTNCMAAHQFMRCFDDHVVESFEEILKSGGTIAHQKPVLCRKHAEENLVSFCNVCQVPVCQKCMVVEHVLPEHPCVPLSEVEGLSTDDLKSLMARAHLKLTAVCEASESMADLTDLQDQKEHAQGLINETFQSIKACLENIRDEFMAELALRHSKMELVQMETSQSRANIETRLESACDFTEKLVSADNSPYLPMYNKRAETQLLSLINSPMEPSVNATIEFKTDVAAFENMVKTKFGWFINDEPKMPVMGSYGKVMAATAPTFNPMTVVPSMMSAAEQLVGHVVSTESGAEFLTPSMPAMSNVSQLAALTSAAFDSMPAITSVPPPIPPLDPVPSRTSLSPAMSDSGISMDSGGNSNNSATMMNIAAMAKMAANGQAILGSGLPEVSSSSGPGSGGIGSGGPASRTQTPMLGQGATGGDGSSLHSAILAGVASSQPPSVQTENLEHLASLLNSQPPPPSLPYSMPSMDMPPVSGQSHPLPSPSMPYSMSPSMDMPPVSVGGEMGPPGLGSPNGNNFGSNATAAAPYPPVRRASKMSAMQIRCKFGQLGPGKCQFNSPHGFCLGIEQDIIVADTNNHRIQVFEKTGEFKSQFGIPGREEGQLWYPRKVAVMRPSGKFVVCDRGNERSRMQIFSRSGHFLKKIAIRYIDIVAGLAITASGNIVAVDSVSPTVFVISEAGDLVKWFDCSDYMREPSDIAVSNKEYFVCDFKGHCVVVFNEDGNFLRRIGCENITNYPNGIDISDAGDVLIGDSHGNRFHVAVFQRDGSLIGEFQCPYVKVSRCCGLKITSEGYIVTLAKNNHHVLVLNTLYIM